MKSHQDADLNNGGVSVQMIQSMAGVDFSYASGDIVVVADVVRRAWLQAGIAIDPVETIEDASDGTAPERAVTRRRAR